MVDIPTAQPLPTNVSDASLGAGLSKGLELGSQMAYRSRMAQVEEQKQAQEKQKLQFEMQQAQYKNAQAALERVVPLYDSAPRGTQPALWAFTKKQLMILNPDLNLPDTPPPPGTGKDLNYFLEQNKKWHDSGGKEGLNDADAHFGASQYLTTESKNWATVDQSILNSSPLGASKTVVSGGPGKPVAAFNPSAGDVTPLPGGTPTTASLPGGTSPTDITTPIQKDLAARLAPISNALSAAHAVKQFSKLAAKDSTGAADWPYLENAVVALNPNLAGPIDQVGGLNAQTAPSLLKAGGIPEQLTGFIQAKAGGGVITKEQRDATDALVNEAANFNRTRANSLIQGAAGMAKAQGGDPNAVVNPFPETLPPNEGNTDGQDISAGAALAKKHMSLIPGAVPIQPTQDAGSQ